MLLCNLGVAVAQCYKGSSIVRFVWQIVPKYGVRMSAILNNWKLVLLCAVALFASGCVLDDDDDTAAPLETGLQTVQSGGVEREYFLQLPADYDDGSAVQATAIGDDTRKPLLIAYHGYTGSYQNWLGENAFYHRGIPVADVV